MARSPEDIAGEYGWSMAVLNSDPELRALFDRAVKETWVASKFVVELRDTNWFKKHGEAARQAIVLKQSDPATWAQRLQQQRAHILQLGSQMGVKFTTPSDQIAEQALMFGWDETQLRRVLSEMVRFGDGNLYGQAAQWETELVDFARSMGVRMSEQWYQEYIRRASVDGGASLETAKDIMRKNAMSAFPQLAERIQGGETVADIASPYKQSMAQILELNPESIDVFDPSVRSALAGVDKDGQPAMKSIWQFELGLRKDPRWTKTNNAREQGMAVTRQVLNDMGLSF